MTSAPQVLDVRPLLKAGGEPFGDIMNAIIALEPDQSLRLLTTFRPAPLFVVLGKKGFTFETHEHAPDDWETLFTPSGQAESVLQPTTSNADDDIKIDLPADWPSAIQQLDFRDLDPPEPMTRTLEAIEGLNAGDVLSVFLCREPLFLLPELAKRGHDWHGAFNSDETSYRIAIRAGMRTGDAL